MDKSKLSIDTLTIIGGALAWIYQFWNTRFRTQLKADFEILKTLETLGHEAQNYKIVKTHIDNTISKAYACGHSQIYKTARWHVNLIDLIFGICFLSVFVVWIVQLFKFGSVWWRVLIAAVFAVSFAMALLNVLRKRGVSKNVQAMIDESSVGTTSSSDADYRNSAEPAASGGLHQS